MPRAAPIVFVGVAATLAGLYFATQLQLAYPSDVRGSWGYAIGTNLAHYWVWGALVPAIVWLARRFPLDAGRWRRSVPAHLLLAAALTVAQILVATTILWSIGLTKLTAMPRVLGASLTLNFHASYPTYWVVLLAYTAWRAASLGARLAEARLEALRAQLQPHFLFNALNSISSLMYSDVEAADAMMTRLGDLLRLTLAGGPRREIALAEELDLVGRYLEIERIRFEDRLRVEVDADPAALAAHVPPLLLQPLVENAVRHAVAPRPAGGRVSIRAALEGRALVVRVVDDGPGPPAPVVEGIGLGNSRARLAELYGAAARLSLEEAPGGGAVARVVIPQGVWSAR